MHRLMADPDLLGLPDPEFFRSVPGRVRRLVGIPDLEGKTRVIAILDYWSQTALRPVHDFLFGVLRTIHQDMTFNQGSFVDHVGRWGQGATLYSIDLTAATDRFPVDVIALVLRGHFGQNFVQAWRDIMVGYPFMTPEGKEVSYSVGNPMGAMSSWSSFALTHHFVVYVACVRLGMKWRSCKYVVLGDDVLIGDPLLAEEYLAMLVALGVEVSSAKTYVSPHMCEFAKRYLFEGEEVTPFPVSSVTSNLGDVSLLVSGMMGETRKGLRPSSGIPGAVETLSRVIGRSYRTSRELSKMAREVELGTLFVQGFVEAGEFLLRLNHTLDEPSRDYLHSMSGAIVEGAIRDFVLGSLSKRSTSIGPRFLAEVDELMKPSGRFKVTADRMSLVPAYSVLVAFSAKAGLFYKRGLSLLEGDSGSLVGEQLGDILSESLTLDNPKMDARGRRARAWGRFGRLLRRHSGRVLKKYPLERGETREVSFITLPGKSSGYPIGSLHSILGGNLPTVRVIRAYRNPNVSWG
jgi:hypothetical protein